MITVAICKAPIPYQRIQDIQLIGIAERLRNHIILHCTSHLRLPSLLNYHLIIHHALHPDLVTFESNVPLAASMGE